MPVLKHTTDGVTWAKLVGPEGARGPQGPPGPTSSGRNRIINSNFVVNQRAFTTYSNANAYGFDRWRSSVNGGTSTYTARSILGELGSAANCVRVTTTGQTLATHYTQLATIIEGVTTLSGREATISFWAKATSGAPWVGVGIYQNFGTGGSVAATYGAGKVQLSTAWQRYSLTGVIPSVEAYFVGSDSDYLSIDFWFSDGGNYAVRSSGVPIQSNTFDLYGVQLEEGPHATPYENRAITEELNACQRYFQRWTQPPLRGASGTNTASRLAMPLPVTMRIAPTMVMSGALPLWNGGVTGTVTALGTSYNTPMTVEFTPAVTWTTAANRFAIVYQSGASYLDLNAEMTTG